MTYIVPYFNGALTLMENAFNLIGYLPKEQFSHLNAWSTAWRFRYGSIQLISGVALFALGLLAECLSRRPSFSNYLSFREQMMSLGLLYANHGGFNLIRSYVEKTSWGGKVTFAYDFYGRKVLPPLSLPYDLQGRLFERIRDLLDRIHFVTFFPIQISFRRFD